MVATFHATVLMVPEVGSSLREPAPSVQRNGETFVVAQPDHEFEVEVEAKGISPGQVYLATLRVDRQEVGYAKRVHGTRPSAVFSGWYAGGGKFTDFRFLSAQSRPSSSPASTSGRERQPEVQSLGLVEVTFVKQRPVPCKRTRNGARRCNFCDDNEAWFWGTGVDQAQGEGAGPGLGPGSCDDKKFFLKPSLRVATSGRVCHFTARTKPSVHYVDVSPSEPMTVTLRCETRSTLSLRGILPPIPLPTVPACTHQQPPRSSVSPAGARVKGEAKQEADAAQGNPGERLARRRSTGVAAPAAVERANDTDEIEEVSRTPARERNGGSAVKPIVILDVSDEEREPGGSRRKRRRPCVLPCTGGGQSTLWVWEEDRQVETVVLD